MNQILNAYRIMWVFVFFDLPTNTKPERQAAAKFRKELLKDGFDMFQFSIYTRLTPSHEHAEVHIDRVQQVLPDYGKVGVVKITDKQFGDMRIFYGKKQVSAPKGPQQLELF